MFAIDEFIGACHEALTESQPVLAVRDLMDRTVADPATGRTFTPDRSAFEVLHRSDQLTVLHLALPSGLGSRPHDHKIWAVVGVVDGQEDNSFFRRGPDALVASGGRQVHEREVLVMGDDTIHAIRNPRTGYLSALHVYGGDLFGVGRVEWDADGRNEHPYDDARIEGLIAAARATEERIGRGLTGDDVTAFMTSQSRA